MPATIAPVTVSIPVTTTQALVCDSLFADYLSIDASARLSGNPKLSAKLTPYQSATGIFAATSTPVNTSNLYGVAANIPEVATWLQAGFVAMTAMNNYLIARRADVVTAQAAVTAAQSALNTLAAARTTPPSEPSESAYVAGQNAVQTASQNLATANAALLDPALPHL